MRRKLLKKTCSLLLSITTTFQLLLPSLSFSVAYAQDVTPEPTTVTEQGSVAPTEAPAPVETNTPEPTAVIEPTAVVEPTIVPTSEPTVEPTAEPTKETVVEPTKIVEVTVTDTVAPTETAAPEPTAIPSTEPTPEPQGEVIASVVDTSVLNAALSTDKADYAPTESVIITGSGLKTNHDYKLLITSVNEFSFSTSITTDDAGNFVYIYQLDGTYRPTYEVFVKEGDSSVIATAFTDKPAVNLDQCANGGVTDPPVQCIGSAWQNGNLGQSQAHYQEGQTVPYRAILTGLEKDEIYTVKIEYDTTQSGKHAIDYLKTYTVTEINADACSSVAGVPAGACSTSTSYPIPLDLNVSSGGVTQSNGNFTLYNGSITGVSAYTLSGTYTGNSSTNIVVTIKATANGTGVLAWGGHIATRADWGANNSAIAISGSPYHMRLIDFTCSNVSNCSSGNQDRSLSAEAVIYPASITVTKDAVPNDSQDFSFSTTNLPTPSFSLDDDSDNALTNSRLIDNIVTFGTKTITEAAVSGWALTNLVCIKNSGTGSVTSTDLATRTATINVEEGDIFSCTFTNTQQQAHLTLVKTVTNDNGGSALPSAWTLTATGPTTISGTSGSGSVTNAAVNVGTYTLSENSGPTGYAAGTWNCVGATVNNGQITLVPNDSATCTINNDDQAAHLIVIKHVDNGNTGATYSATDFSMTINSVTAAGGNTFAGVESPGVNKTLSSVGSYTVSETGPAGYTADYSADCSGTIALGQTKTCTITNTADAPKLKLIKTVTNDNGGTKVVSDFVLKIDDATVTSGVFNPVTIGAHTASEISLPGYGASAWGTDCAANGSVTLALGDTKTCTITNNDIAPILHLRKVVTNDNGGSATTANFTLTADGILDNDISGTSPVDSGAGLRADTFTLMESGPSGYTGSAWVCVGGTQNGTDPYITLGIGQEATCTVTNDDEQAYIIINKTVVNNNGGTAGPNDFLLKVDGSSVLDEVAYPVNPGSHTASETVLAGYTAGSWGGDCATDGSVTVALGQTKTCTITNDDQPASLTVIKHVINDNGGSKTAADFTMNVTGTSVSDPSFPGEESPGTTVTLNAGSYSVDENAVSDYSKTLGANCSGTIANGESKTCTITNDDNMPSLTLVKQVINDNGGTAVATDWTLTATGPTQISGAGGVSSGVNFNAGTYTLSESMKAGYNGSDFVCVGGTQSADKHQITLGLGESATCTITNNDIAPTLKLVKIVTNDNGGTKVSGDWDLTAAGVLLGFTDEGDSTAFHTVKAGVEYTLSESDIPGYLATTWNCNGGSFNLNKVTLGLDEDVTCTITNDDIAPKLTLVKTVINDNGGNKLIADFPLFINGYAVTSGVANTLSANTLYTASETSQTGYAASAWGGDCTESGTITLLPGDDKTCTITNNDVAPKLTLIKTVVNNNGGTKLVADFPLFINGNSVTSGVKNTLAANILYTATETTLTGYDPSLWGGDCAADGTITLLPGDDKTCTITNDDIAPTLTVTKILIPNNDGGKFNLRIGSVTHATNVGDGGTTGAVTVNAGSHTVSEIAGTDTVLGDYTSVIGGDCALNGSITLGLAENRTCTITNTHKGKIIVEKQTLPDGDTTTFEFNPSWSAANFNISDGQQNDSGWIIPGTYSVAEITKTGWDMTSATCNDGSPVTAINLDAGETVTCTFTNTKQASLTIVKDAVPQDCQNFKFSMTEQSDFYLDDSDGVTDCCILPSDTNEPNTKTFGNLSANETYRVTEAVPNGYWAYRGASCVLTGTAIPYANAASISNGLDVTLLPGVNVTCTFVNEKPMPTRTQGFWKTHTDFTTSVFINKSGGTIQLGINSGYKTIIDTKEKLFGVWYSDLNFKTSTNGKKLVKRSNIEKARLLLAHQLVTAKLNCALFGSCPDIITQGDIAYSGTNINAMTSAMNALDKFNNSGDSITPDWWTKPGSATPKKSESIANKAFWDILS